MTKTVDPETADRIRVALESDEVIEVRNSVGQLVDTLTVSRLLLESLILKGFIRPTEGPPAGPLPPTISWEEMRRRAAERGGRTTAEILAELAESAKHR